LVLLCAKQKLRVGEAARRDPPRVHRDPQAGRRAPRLQAPLSGAGAGEAIAASLNGLAFERTADPGALPDELFAEFVTAVLGCAIAAP